MMPMRRLLRRALLVACALLLLLPIAGEVLVRLFADVHDIGPILSSFDPEYGKVPKRSFHATRRTPEFVMSFSTNSLGCRGAEPPPASPGAKDLLCVGDSYCMGFGVNDGEEYPALVMQ